MSNAEQTNLAMKELAKVTGASEAELEIIHPFDTIQDAIPKFTNNLTKCLASFTEGNFNNQ